jgi:hypothetical protein
LYFHNFILEEKREDNPGPFIGDIQFQAFLSFTQNQVRWGKSHKTFLKREAGLDLWVRGEPPKSFPAIMPHKTFMKRGGVVDSLAPIHLQVIRSCITHFRELKEEALAASKLRWDASSSEVKSREPFGTRISLQLPLEYKGILDFSKSKDLLGLGEDIIPLSSGFLQKVTKNIIKLTRKGRMLLLENSKEAMGSRGLVNQRFHLTELLLYM